MATRILSIKHQGWLLLPVLSYCASIDAEEDDVLLGMSMEELLAIEVTVASNVVTNLRQQPVSISTINNDQILLSGARTLNELLTIYVPGFFMTEDQDDTIAAFRGLVPDNNSKVMLLIDGERINTEWFWGPPDAILNTLDLDMIERIEVIRGPGSVTLGQGALLGVINVITKGDQQGTGAVNIKAGEDGYRTLSARAKFGTDDFSASVYVADGQYDGTELPNKGWTGIRQEQGLSVHERNHRLHRGEFTNLLASLETDSFELDYYHFNQERDLYNFYRDREVVEQTLDALFGHYEYDFDDNLSLKITANYAIDDYALASHGNNQVSANRLVYEATGSGFASVFNTPPNQANGRVTADLTMGGTREKRSGLKMILNHQLSDNHQLAYGVDIQRYAMGRKNADGDNFILNEEIQTLGLVTDGMGGFVVSGDLNATNTWVKPKSLTIKSLFAEDFYQFNDEWLGFAAFRYDDHPNWGSHVSPRFGLIFDQGEHLFRFTYQTGYRGAVGIQYAGGFVQDGFLAEHNFPVINGLADTEVDFDFDGVAGNDFNQLEPVEPETLESLEFAYSYQGEDKQLNAVVFINKIEDILTAEAHGYESFAYGDSVGDDVVGTWGGNWYYQNQQGQIQFYGLELEYQQRYESLDLRVSHSMVRVANADSEAQGVYVLASDELAAYPKDVTRLHLAYNLNTDMADWRLMLNHLYYWEYFAPTESSEDGGSITHLGLSMALRNLPLTISLQMKNLFDESSPYPINGTGNIQGAEGVYTIPPRSVWLSAQYQF